MLGSTLYAGGTDIAYYGDDFQFYFGTAPQHPLFYFFHKNPYALHTYRPVEAVFLSQMQYAFGMITFPIHLTQISLHILLCCLLLSGMRRQGFSCTQSFLAALYLLVSQANPHAVLSNDTFSQVLGALTGFLSLYFFSLWVADEPTVPPSRNKLFYLSSLGFFSLSLFAKETSASFFLIILGMLLVDKGLTVRQGSVFRSFVIQSAPFTVVLVVYLSIRFSLGLPGVQFGQEDYQFRIGKNVLYNIALLTFQAFLPYSSVDTFVAVQTGVYPKLLLALVSTGVIMTATAYGHWRMRTPRVSFALCVLILVSFFPVFLLNHVSELYVYNAMPAVAILFGVGIGRLVTSRSHVRGVAIVCSLGLLLAHAASVQSKTRLMKANGNRAGLLLREIRPYLQTVPADGYLLLVNPSADCLQYSVFLLPGFRVLEKGLHYLYTVAGRDNFAIEVLDEATLSWRSLRHAVVLTLDGNGDIIPWTQSVQAPHEGHRAERSPSFTR